MTFNYEQFKARFREAAARRGIDPMEGATEAQSRTLLVELNYASKPSSFQIVMMNAETNADLHHSRMRELVRAAAERQAAQFKRGIRWEEGGGLLHPDGSIDEMRLAKAESVDWWDQMNPDDWKPGAGSSYVERQAITPIRRNVRARRFQLAGELVQELLEEYPTQAEMNPKKSQKEKV